ncbi:sigma factor-like helix-turn-helix DNA-binding protein [Novosphingobium sp.]|uniref:sigma factor-like helix-turn-helix DNA-binding protein n=1 Tax=Novosphingobium sp. TaxID=1874826 RepID=UPI001D6D311B|nr:sigma factor-like helix-turn-helix DNA-binding protein [Novosphingobium sp.]MBX9665311.1 LuxR C-terminal-related transcriptional regulator [Novosphingobium sp.]
MGKSEHRVASPRPPGADDSAYLAPAYARPDQAGSPRSESADLEIREDILASLTDKQRAVLDLLIEHKTSKEISRILGISHHTVDQRILLARAKLGVATRSEVAQAYRRLVATPATVAAVYERSVYDFSDVAPPLDDLQEPMREDKVDWLESPPDRKEALAKVAVQSGEALAEPYHHVLPEMFDGPYGTYIRLGTIAIFAMFLILIVMGGLAMFAQLSQIIAH